MSDFENHRNYNAGKSTKVWIENPPSPDDKSKDYFYTKIGIVVNILMLFFTGLLWYLTWQSLKVSTGALNAANAATRQSIRANNLAEQGLRFARDNALSSDTSTKKALALSEKSVKAQIENIVEAQKQFEISNRPYLQVGKLDIDSSDKEEYGFIYEIQNLGNYPAEIIYNIDEIAQGTAPPDLDLVKSRGHRESNSDLIVKGYPHRIKILGAGNTDAVYKKPIAFIYYTGVIRYRNLVTKKVSQYEYQMRMQSDYKGWTPLINRTIDFTDQ